MWGSTLRATRATRQIAGLGLILALLTCASCAHRDLEAVPRTDAAAQQLIGQVIRVTTKDGQVLEFGLLQVTEDALVGASRQVRFEDVALLEGRESSSQNAACLVARAALWGAAFAGALLLLWIASLPST